jgi:hypothetical protein
MRRFTVLILVLILVPVSCLSFTLKEFGFRVNLDRLATLSTNTGRWHASVAAYIQIELDSVWQVKTGIGFDFAKMAPVASIGLLRSITDSMLIEADLSLKWIPRYGVVGIIDTGMSCYPMISGQSQLIVEVYPIRWQVISVEHRYIPVPELNLALTIGVAMLLNQGGFFGETVTIDAYKVAHRRLPFSLFVGSGWYLTAGQLTTRVGCRL